jgi:glutaredoxin
MIKIYGIADCHYCTKAIQFCIERNIIYTYTQIPKKDYIRFVNSLNDKNEVIKTAPSVFINDYPYIGGYNSMVVALTE